MKGLIKDYHPCVGHGAALTVQGQGSRLHLCVWFSTLSFLYRTSTSSLKETHAIHHRICVLHLGENSALRLKLSFAGAHTRIFLTALHTREPIDTLNYHSLVTACQCYRKSQLLPTLCVCMRACMCVRVCTSMRVCMCVHACMCMHLNQNQLVCHRNKATVRQMSTNTKLDEQ